MFVLKYIKKNPWHCTKFYQGSTRSQQKCITSWFLIYTCTSTNLASLSMGHLSLAFGPSPPGPAPLLEGGPWVLRSFQDCYKTILQLFFITKRDFTFLQGVILSLIFLLPDSLTPSAAGFFALYAESLFGHILLLLSSYNLNFPLPPYPTMKSLAPSPWWLLRKYKGSCCSPAAVSS